MIGKWFEGSKEYSTLIIRIGVGVVFVFYGAQKLFGMFGGAGISGTTAGFASMGFPAPGVMAVLAGVGELLGGLLVLPGIITRYAAGTLLVIMLVAMFVVHWKHGFAAMAFPFAMAMMAGSLVVSGGGRASVDKIIKIDERV